MKKLLSLILVLLIGVTLVSCTEAPINDTTLTTGDNAVVTDDVTTEAPVDENTICFDLTDFDDENFEVANGWRNNVPFNCIWRKDNIKFNDGIMSMTIDLDDISAGEKVWSGAEYRTWEFFHYGMYEVRMKPISNSGVVSSFATYTGHYYDDPWDEIDIEFLGKNTNQVQFNHFADAKDGDSEKNAYVYDLGFDASLDFHIYGYEWLPDSITWYVDGVAVYTVSHDIPTTAGKIIINVWPGIGVDSWLGAFDGNVPLTAEYDWMKYTPYEAKEIE